MLLGGSNYESSHSTANHLILKTFQSKEGIEEGKRTTNAKEKGEMSPQTEEVEVEMTGGCEQNIIVTSFKIRFF